MCQAYRVVSLVLYYFYRNFMLLNPSQAPHFKIWKVLKCGAGEGWRSVGPIVWEMRKCYVFNEERNIIHIMIDSLGIQYSECLSSTIRIYSHTKPIIRNPPLDVRLPLTAKRYNSLRFWNLRFHHLIHNSLLFASTAGGTKTVQIPPSSIFNSFNIAPPIDPSLPRGLVIQFLLSTFILFCTPNACRMISPAHHLLCLHLDFSSDLSRPEFSRKNYLGILSSSTVFPLMDPLLFIYLFTYNSFTWYLPIARFLIVRLFYFAVIAVIIRLLRESNE